MEPWTSRFFDSTRGRLVAMLRRSALTVEEMASALGVTDNAVRAQLVALERDGVVRQAGVRRGGGKPSYTYALVPEFETALSRAYGPLLVQVLRELARRTPDAELVDLLKAVGQRWAEDLPKPGADRRSRAAAASALLNELGGATEVEERDGRLLVRGFTCPLAAAVREEPRVCLAVETLLGELLGLPVRECCDRAGDGARCCFEIG